MANLYSIAELAHRSLYPETNAKPAVTLAEFIATAKHEYATAMWIYRQEMIALDGFFDMPSNLLTEVELPVKNNQIDLSGLKYLDGLPGDLWLQNIGGDNCECKYIKSTLNLSQLLCEDDSMADDQKPFYIQGKKIKLPKGAHAEKVTIVYANTGTGLDEKTLDVNDYVGSKVRTKLIQLYGAKAPVDTTNNQNPNE